MKQIMIQKYRCKKCGFEWIPRIEGMPKLCPSCKCRKWHNYKLSEVVERKADEVPS